MARLLTIVAIYGICFGAAAWLPFSGRSSGAGSDKKKFTWIWIAPALAFFTLVFLNWVNSGYLLVASPPIFAWLGSQAATFYDKSQAAPGRKIAVAAAVAGVNTAFFLLAPLYFSYRSMREFERELVAVQKDVRSLAAPQDTLIVGFDSHFLGYRHAAYYLPEFLTVQYPEVRLAGASRVFVVQHRDTRLLSKLPIERFHRFVLFPLPSGKEYWEYSNRVRSRFPKTALRATVLDGREFLSGSTADLSFLFPTAAAASAQTYTEGHHRP